MKGLPAYLAGRSPVYYGWVVLACVCCAGFARQGPAVATLSIFIDPMTTEFGWSRASISGAVSLGGLLAAVSSPFLGPLVDKHGARAMLCWAVALTGGSALLLSGTQSLVMFYVLFCIARMNFAGPFDLGIYGAINSWFVTRRPIATSVQTLAMMVGLTAMPLIAHAAMALDGWRMGWIAVGMTVLLVGFLPTWLLMAKSPEDLGLPVDPVNPGYPATATNPTAPKAADGTTATAKPAFVEGNFTRPEAMRTSAFWLLSFFTFIVYPVQAGVSLHQAPHLIERGLDPGTAALIVGTFSAVSGLVGFLVGPVVRRAGVRLSLMATSLFMGAGSLGMIGVEGPAMGYVSAAVFGTGIGGLLTVLPIAWADTFGRKSFGAIRGVALTVQVTGQAIGPVLSGVLWDLTGDYTLSLEVFGAFAGAGMLAILFLRQPKPVERPESTGQGS